MKQLMISLLLAVLVLPALLVAQPVLRTGWPHDFGEEDLAGITMYNPLTVTVLEDGTHLIAAATPHEIRLFDRDGTLLAEWPVAGTLADPLSADTLSSGPNIGDVDGDGDPEIVVGLRDFNSRVRGLGVYELDGSINTTLTQSWSISSTNFSPVVLENLDDDPALEIVFTGGAQMHAIDQDGGELEGFPWNIGPIASQAWTGVTVVPSWATGGSPVLVWMSENYYIHAREIGQEVERNGFPTSFESPGGINRAGPVVIPRPDGWYVAIVDPWYAHVWDQDGNSPPGFPRPLPTGSGPLTWMSVADVDGDNSPELLFRCWNNANLHAINLESEYVPLYPLALSSEGTGNPQVVAVKTSFTEPAMLFMGSKGEELSDVSFMGYQNGDPLPGFPVELTVTEWQARPRVALFPPDDDGLMSIVFHTTFGYTTVYDLPVELDETATLEWAMPFGQATGNRVYRPTILGQGPLPFFRFSVDTLELGQPLVFDDVQQSFTIQNLGEMPGEVSSIQLAIDEYEDEFTIEPAAPFTIEAGARETITVYWTPESAYEIEGNLVFNHDPAPTVDETVIELRGRADHPPVLLIPTFLDFGVISEPVPHGTTVLAIENDGSGEGRIDTILVPTAYASQITADTEFPVVIPPTGTAMINLTWEPEELGVLATSIELLHNDPFLENATSVQVSGVWTLGVGDGELPLSFSLEQNHPNPFNPETTIRYSLAKPGDVKLTVYSLEGREVQTLVDGFRGAGVHSVQFNGHTLASGVYLYKLETNQFRALRKMILVR